MNYLVNYSIKSKALILVISAFVALSCNKSKTAENKTEVKENYFNDTILASQENPKIVEYREFLSTLDSVDANSVTAAIDMYKEIFSGQSKGLCDSAFVMFQNKLDTIELTLNNQLTNDTTDYAAVLSSGNIPVKIKEFKAALQKNGLNLVHADDLVYIEQQRKFVLNVFSEFISESLNQYLTEIDTESREGFSKENKIVISPQKMVDRIIWYENFIKANPNFVLLDNCKNYKKAYFTYLLEGYGDTKLFVSEESKDLSVFFASAYKYLLKKYPDSESTELVKPYYDALLQKQPTSDMLKKYYIKGVIYNLN